MSAEKDAGLPKLFDVPAETVIAAVGCAWCCVEIADPCREKGYRLGVPHAQRWREYHNATHGPRDQTPIYTAYGVQVNRVRWSSVTSPAESDAPQADGPSW